MSDKIDVAVSKGSSVVKDGEDRASAMIKKVGHTVQEAAEKAGHGAKEMATGNVNPQLITARLLRELATSLT